MSRLVTPYHVTSYLFIYQQVLTHHVLSYFVMPYHVISCHVLLIAHSENTFFMYYFCSPCPVGFNRIVEFQAPPQIRIDDCNCLVFNLPSQLSEWTDVLLWLIHREQENPPFSLQTTALFPIRLQV